MIRVLLFTANEYPAGVLTFVNQMYAYRDMYKAAGIEITFLTQEENPIKELYPIDTDFLPIHRVTQRPYRNPRLSARFYYKVFYAIKKFVWRIKFPYIYLKNNRVISQYLNEKSYDYVISNSGGYVLSICTQFLKIAERCNVPERIFLSHHYPSTDRKGIYERIRGYILDSTVDKYATDFITVSQYCARKINEVSGINHKIDVIYNGIDRKLSPMMREEKRKMLVGDANKNKYIIGMIGTFWEYKGQIYFIKLIEELYSRGIDNFVGVIIGGRGDRKYFEKCVQYIENKGLQEYVYIYESINDASTYVEAYDTLIMPSIIESFGLVAVEAMMWKVPVLAFETGGIPEVVINGQTGRLVRKYDYFAMADEICHMMNDSGWHDSLASQGEACWREKFSGRAMNEEYLKYFMKLGKDKII